MKRCLTKSKLVASLGALSLYAPLFAQDDWSLNNQWFLRGEWVFMRRADIHNHSIVSDSNRPPKCNGCPNFKALDTENLVHDFDFESGYRATLTYMMNKLSSFEASYMEIAQWQGDHTVRGQGTLSFPFTDSSYAQDFTRADEARAAYDSKFYNVEFNYWGYSSPPRVDYFSAAWIAGLRYMNLREHFDVSFHRSGNKSTYKIETHNHLIGPQLGANIQMNPIRCLSWDFNVKVGYFLDYAKQESSLGDRDNSIKLRDFEKHECTGTLLVDVLASLSFYFGNHFSIRSGYQMIYLTGLALAPEQVDKNVDPHSGKHLDTKGEATIHGLFVGGTFAF